MVKQSMKETTDFLMWGDRNIHRSAKELLPVRVAYSTRTRPVSMKAMLCRHLAN